MAKKSGGRSLGRKIPGSLYQKRDRWYWSVRPPSEKGFRNVALIPVGQKYATRNKAVAESIARRLWKEWGLVSFDQVSRSLPDWIDWFKEVNSMEASERQGERNAQILRAFTEDMRDVDEMTPGVVQAYLLGLQKKKLAPATIHKHRNTVRKFCRFLIRHGVIDLNPAGRDMVSVPRVYSRPPRFLTDKQGRVFLRSMKDSPAYGAAMLGLYCGLRLGEIMALKGGHITNGQVTVGVDQPTKTYSWRVVPVPRRVRAALPEVSPDEYIFPRWKTASWVQHLRKRTEDLPVFGELEGRRTGNQWHLLRATWAVNMARGKYELRRALTIWELMARAGWVNPQTAMRYINIARAAGA